MLAYQGEETCSGNGSSRVGSQCVNISAPMTLQPAVEVGTVSVTYQGVPVIACVTNGDGTSCTVTMTQQVCVSIPVRYGVTMTTGEAAIGCADHCIGTGCC